jgi:hypothetical protein
MENDKQPLHTAHEFGFERKHVAQIRGAFEFIANVEAMRLLLLTSPVLLTETEKGNLSHHCAVSTFWIPKEFQPGTLQH